MEQLTFSPLIEHLREHAAELNQLRKACIPDASRMDTAMAVRWFHEVIEPVFVAVCQYDPARAPQVFRILYIDMLRVFAAGRAQADPLVIQCRRLLAHNPKLTASEPQRILELLDHALRHIVSHSPKAAMPWLELMEKVLGKVADIDLMILAARFAAWRCGMAPLRHLLDPWPALPVALREIIFAGEPIGEQEVQTGWTKGAPVYAWTIGAFKGFQGKFRRPPRVTLHDGLVVATDGEVQAVVFADRFGVVLHDAMRLAPPSFPKKPPPHSSLRADIARIIGSYSDCTSWVLHDSALYLTTACSHAIFLFGAFHDS